MRHTLASAVLLGGLLLTSSTGRGVASPEVSSGAKKLGAFGDWIAATHQESAQTVCYAFTYAQHSSPALPSRDPVVLTVTQRPSGRDAVAIAAGFGFATRAAVTIQVDQAGFEFYTAQRNAFARDGRAVIAAFQTGSGAIARLPGPYDAQVTDTFSLRGFLAAYAAVIKACPPTTSFSSPSPRPPLATAIAPPPADVPMQGRSLAIPLQIQGGTFLVPVLINDTLKLQFMVDSGATDVSIPADVVLTLMRTGTLDKSDFMGKRTYRLADGSTVPSTIFRIRALKVGDRELKDVTGSIASVEGSLLLGQSFLSRFKSWSIDNHRRVLVLE